MTVSGYADIGMASSRVLLIGSRWESLSATLKVLAGRGRLTFVGPSNRGTPEILSQVAPSVIMVSPGCDSADALAPDDHDYGRGDLPEAPPVLICVTLEDLENDALPPESDGFDDFLVVPCSAAELEHRLRRLARKNVPAVAASQLSVGEITLDPETYQVRLAGQVVALAWMEFQLLKFLMEHPGRVFTRENLLSSVWGIDSFGGTRTVDVHIRKLRSKLEIHGDEYIRTVKNVGYGMIAPN